MKSIEQDIAESEEMLRALICSVCRGHEWIYQRMPSGALFMRGCPACVDIKDQPDPYVQHAGLVVSRETKKLLVKAGIKA